MPKRQVVLDTETTGLYADQGDRIIEIGAVEMIDREMTGRDFHCYLNPNRAISSGAAAVHGLTQDFLKDKPNFEDMVEALLNYLKGAELIIHNAPFDMGFLNAELSRLSKGYGVITDYCTVFDTLAYARSRHVAQRNSLDALCERYEIDASHRTLHGAKLDALLLAKVFLAMTGGQMSLFNEKDEHLAIGRAAKISERAKRNSQLLERRKLCVIVATAAEEAAHKDFLLNVLKQKDRA